MHSFLNPASRRQQAEARNGLEQGSRLNEYSPVYADRST